MITRDLKEVGTKLEEMIRKEMKASAPIPWNMENVGQPEATMSKEEQKASAGVGGQLGIHHAFSFDLPGARPAQAFVGIIQTGMESEPARLLYGTMLSKPISGKASLSQQPRGGAVFQGDADLCQKLNSNKEVMSSALKLYKGKVTLGRITMNVNPIVDIQPTGTGSKLVVQTVPSFNMLMHPTFHLKEFFDLAELLETVL